MTSFVFDIETMPLSREKLELQMPEFTAPANLRDPLKIEAAIQEKRENYFEKAALSPITSRVCMIGHQRISATVNEPIGQGSLMPKDWEDETELDALEAQIITEFWAMVNTAIHHGCLIVGFNSHGFDLPFLVKRSMKHRIPTGLPPYNGRYPFQAPFVDLAEKWQMGRKEEYTSLDALARFLGVGKKEGDGKDCANLLRTDPEKAHAYLVNDITLTAGIARIILH